MLKQTENVLQNADDATVDVERANPKTGPCLPTPASAAATLATSLLILLFLDDIHCLMC